MKMFGILRELQKCNTETQCECVSSARHPTPLILAVKEAEADGLQFGVLPDNLASLYLKVK